MTGIRSDRRHLARTLGLLVGLYVAALLVRLFAAGQLPFAPFEPSVYYTSVAQNLVEGKGLVSDAVWSYATPPLTVPKPAFELWLPMSSLVSSMAMTVLGPSLWAAQVAGAMLGALLAPLTWMVALVGARTAELDARRAGAVALAAGLLAVVLGPFVLGSVVPDSYMPFTTFAVMAALLIPLVVGVRDGDEGRRLASRDVIPGLALGVALGLAYLSRQEAVWLGLTVLLMLGWALRSRPRSARLPEALSRLWPVMAGGLVVVVPWLIRNAATFGSAFPGQAVENMVLVRNEDIYAFAERPDLTRYLDQGLATILWNPVAAAWDGLINVVLIPAFPVGLLGLVAVLAMRGSPALRRPSALVALLIAGGLTFVSTVLLFPVATRWGTFLHASGPVMVALVVAAALGADAALARISALRRWKRPNIVIGPLALVAVTVGLGILQLSLLSSQSRQGQARYEALARSLSALAEGRGSDVPATIITDHPMWLADALDRNAVALPDEDMTSIMALRELFDAPWVVVIDERGRHPDALHDGAARSCLAGDPVALPDETGPAWLFELADRCADS